MSKNKDIMHVDEKYNSKGQLRFVLFCSGKDLLSQKNKVFVKTYAVPSHLTSKKEIEQFRMQCQIEWKEIVNKKSNFIYEKPNISFYDYAEIWVEDIIKNNPTAYHHYTTCKSNLRIFKEKFGKSLLKNINLPVIKEFSKWLNNRSYKKETVIIKNSIKPILNEKNLSIEKAAKLCDISTRTIKVAFDKNNHINRESANKICKNLEIPFDRFFSVEVVEKKFSLGANRSLKIMLHTILSQAVKDGYIDRNYASNEFTAKVIGTTGEKNILKSIESIKHFLDCLKNEDIRLKTSISLGLYLGLRGCEIAGLEWKDIDFENSTIIIERNCMYVGGFGIVTKEPKTKSSKRKICIPQCVKDLLIEYKQWWDDEKYIRNDLWKNTDRLFCQWNGKDMANDTISHWLKNFEKKYSLEHVTLHGLRHSNITMLVTNGVDIKTVSQKVGHSSVQTTLNIYSHYTQESDRKASELVDKLLAI